jgi:mRNA interferase RelE/StbE
VAGYRLLIKASAAKEIERLPTRKLRRAIVARIRALADDPRPTGSVKLSGANKYRIRHGAYRILYRIEDDRLIVVVVRVAHRKTVYR